MHAHRRTQFTQIVNQVEGEAVVIVYKAYHREKAFGFSGSPPRLRLRFTAIADTPLGPA
jgi:hypothetical protein